MNVKDRIKGSFVGLMFGSGVNARFSPMLTSQEARRRFGTKTFEEIPKDYKLYDQYTLAKITYDILLKFGKITPENAKEYLLELHRRENIFRGDIYGPSTQKAVKDILEGKDIHQMGRKGVTCGGAFKSLPVGMYFYNNRKALIENTVDSCVISHNTDIAIGAAIATNITLASLLDGMDKFEAINEGIRVSKELHGRYGERTKEPLIYKRIQNAVSLVKGKTLDKAMVIIPEKIGVSWFARDAIPGAFANYATVNTPEDSSLLSMRCGGDNETVPDIACTFLGAENGPKIFSRDIIRKIEKVNKVKVYDMADRLIEKMDI